MHRLLILTPLLLLTACGGSDSGDGDSATPQPDQHPSGVTITALTISGDTDEPARVTVAGRSDEDGSLDASFSVSLPLDGEVLPADTGGGHTALLDIETKDLAGNSKLVMVHASWND